MLTLCRHIDGREWLMFNGQIIASGKGSLAAHNLKAIKNALQASGMGHKRVARLELDEIVASVRVIEVSHPQYYRPIAA